jgi:hypothetical protein
MHEAECDTTGLESICGGVAWKVGSFRVLIAFGIRGNPTGKYLLPFGWMKTV